MRRSVHTVIGTTAHAMIVAERPYVRNRVADGRPTPVLNVAPDSPLAGPGRMPVHSMIERILIIGVCNIASARRRGRTRAGARGGGAVRAQATRSPWANRSRFQKVHKTFV